MLMLEAQTRPLPDEWKCTKPRVAATQTILHAVQTRFENGFQLCYTYRYPLHHIALCSYPTPVRAHNPLT